MVWIKNVSRLSQASLIKLIASIQFVVIYLSFRSVFNTISFGMWANIIDVAVLSLGAFVAVTYKRPTPKIVVTAGLTYAVAAACTWLAKPDTMQGLMQLTNSVYMAMSLYLISLLLLMLSILLMFRRASDGGQSILITSLQPIDILKNSINRVHNVLQNVIFVLNSSHPSGSGSNKRNSDISEIETYSTASLFRFNPVLLLYLTAFIEGAAVIGAELLGARLLSSFYGASLYVWTAVLSISVLGLACGYFLGGYLSRRNISVVALFMICGVSAAALFFMPAINDLAVSFTKSMWLIPGVTIASSMLLLPSIICFGAMGPLMVHFFSNSASGAETAPGNIFFTSTMGGIFAAFMFGYYIIPSLGLAFATQIMSGMLLIPCVVFLLFRKSILQQTSFSAPVVSKHDKMADEQGGFSTLQIYTISFLEGATVMSLQLLATRMIAPYFGSSIMVWATVMGITLLSLALGYYTGSRLPRTWQNVSVIWWILLAVGISVSNMHIFASRLPFWFINMDLTTSLIAVAVFVVIPSLYFLGMIPTHLVKLRQQSSDAGGAAGMIYGISALGGILAMPFFGFWIIPQFGLTSPSILVALLIGILPAVMLLAKRKYAGLAFLGCLIFSFSQRSMAKPSKNVKVVEYSEGLMGQLLVADLFINGKGEPINDRTMYVNRMGQTVIDNATGNTRYIYITFASSVASVLPENSKALVLGLGGGSMAKELSNNLQFEVDAVELDERIAKAAIKHFALSEKVHVVVDDARHYLETTRKKYDLIFFDVFKGDVLPAQVLTKESFEQARELLNPGGMVLINLNGFITGETGIAGRNIHETLKASGFQVSLLPTPGAEKDRNNLFIATMEEKDFSKVRSPLLFKESPVYIPTLFEVVSEEKVLTIYSDDCSALERHNLMAGNTWRRGYNASVTPFLIENYVPLFK